VLNLQDQDGYDLMVNFERHAAVPDAAPEHTRFTGERRRKYKA
jgi:hypothetical protein